MKIAASVIAWTHHRLLCSQVKTLFCQNNFPLWNVIFSISFVKTRLKLFNFVSVGRAVWANPRKEGPIALPSCQNSRIVFFILAFPIWVLAIFSIPSFCYTDELCNLKKFIILKSTFLQKKPLLLMAFFSHLQMAILWHSNFCHNRRRGFSLGFSPVGYYA